MRGRDRWYRSFLLAGAALGLFPTTGAAQADSARWQGIPVNARVRVTTPGAREIRGILAGWSDSSLTVHTPSDLTIGLREIERLRVARGNHFGKGLWIGASAGTVIGSLIGLIPPNSDFNQGAFVLFGGALGAFGGGVIGGVAGLFTTRWSDVAIPNR